MLQNIVIKSDFFKAAKKAQWRRLIFKIGDSWSLRNIFFVFIVAGAHKKIFEKEKGNESAILRAL